MTSKNDLIFSYDVSLQSFHYSQKATANESTNCNKEYFIHAKGKMFELLTCSVQIRNFQTV